MIEDDARSPEPGEGAGELPDRRQELIIDDGSEQPSMPYSSEPTLAMGRRVS